MAGIDPLRRRLTVSMNDAPSGYAAPGTGPDLDREQLITALGFDNVFAQAEKDDKKAMCVVSITDKERERKAPFSPKDETIVFSPASADQKEMLKWLVTDQSVGWTCRKGYKGERTFVCNQDSMSILAIEDTFALYGVYDGHGPNGHDVSEFVCRTLPKLFLEQLHQEEKSVKEAFETSFTGCQQLIETVLKDKAQMSGTTCTMAFHDLRANILTVAHAGDSRSVLGTREGKAAVALTEDHKPDLPAEKARIERSGGRVIFDGYFNHRVFAKDGMYPGLNMSRALGDIVGHKEAGLSAEAEVLEINLAEGHKGLTGDLTLLLCTDGVWEFITDGQAMEVVASQKGSMTRSIEALVKLGYDSWMKDSDNEISDDITGIMINIPARA